MSFPYLSASPRLGPRAFSCCSLSPASRAHHIRGPELRDDEGFAGASLYVLSLPPSLPSSLSNSPTEDRADPVLWGLLESRCCGLYGTTLFRLRNAQGQVSGVSLGSNPRGPGCVPAVLPALFGGECRDFWSPREPAYSSPQGGWILQAFLERLVFPREVFQVSLGRQVRETTEGFSRMW